MRLDLWKYNIRHIIILTLAIVGLAAVCGVAVAHEMKGAQDVLTDILKTPETGSKMAIISLLLAFVLGALHALTPGHGKTVAAAYLVGSKGTVGDAFILGIITTLGHTSTAIILGLLLLSTSRRFLPARITPVLTSVSGLIIFIIGIWLVASWLRGKHVHHSSSNHHLSHHKSHSNRPKLWKTISVGISGGLVPCPAALAVVLMAIGLGKFGFGLCLLIALSLGLATVLIISGVLFAKGSSFFESYFEQNKLIQKVPLISALIVIWLGIMIVVKSISPGGY